MSKKIIRSNYLKDRIKIETETNIWNVRNKFSKEVKFLPKKY